MTTPTTTPILAFKQAVFDVLTDAVASLTSTGEPARVFYNYPGDANVTRQCIVLNRAHITSSIDGMRSSRAPRLQEFALELDLVANDAAANLDSSSRGSEALVLELFDALDNALADDPSLGDVVLTSQIDTFTFDSFPASSGMVTVMSGRITATTRLL